MYMKKLIRRTGSLLLALNMMAVLVITPVSAAETPPVSVQETDTVPAEVTDDPAAISTASTISEITVEPEDTEEEIPEAAEPENVYIPAELTEEDLSGLSAEDRALMDQPQESLSL